VAGLIIAVAIGCSKSLTGGCLPSSESLPRGTFHLNDWRVSENRPYCYTYIWSRAVLIEWRLVGIGNFANSKGRGSPCARGKP